MSPPSPPFATPIIKLTFEYTLDTLEHGDTKWNLMIKIWRKKWIAKVDGSILQTFCMPKLLLIL